MTSQEVDDVIESAVIERLEYEEGGMKLFLRDGRALVFIDASVMLVVSTRKIIQ